MTAAARAATAELSSPARRGHHPRHLPRCAWLHRMLPRPMVRLRCD